MKVIKAFKFLRGAKTYLVSGLGAVVALAAWYYDLIPRDQALQIVFEALGLSALRAGVSNSIFKNGVMTVTDNEEEE